MKILKKISDKRCMKCNGFFERRSHAKITDKELRKAYYFSEWDYCRYCQHVQHYDEYKVYNTGNKKYPDFKAVEEFKEQLNFINQL